MQFGQKLMQNIFFFGMSNSLINPMIYGAFHLWRPHNKSGGGAGATSYSCAGSRRSKANIYANCGESSFQLNPTVSSTASAYSFRTQHRRQTSSSPTSPAQRETRLQSIKRRLTQGLRRKNEDGTTNSESGSPKSHTPSSGGGGADQAATTSRPRPPPVVRCNTAQNGALIGTVGGVASDAFLRRSNIEASDGADSCSADAIASPSSSTSTPHYHRHSYNGASVMTRCATLDCTSQVDRKKVSLRRRQLKAAQAAAVGGARRRQEMAEPPAFNYTQEILGSMDDGAETEAGRSSEEPSKV